MDSPQEGPGPGRSRQKPLCPWLTAGHRDLGPTTAGPQTLPRPDEPSGVCPSLRGCGPAPKGVAWKTASHLAGLPAHGRARLHLWPRRTAARVGCHTRGHAGASGSGRLCTGPRDQQAWGAGGVLVSPRGTGAEPLSLGGPGGPAQPEALPERAVTPLSPFCRDTHLPLTPPKSHRDPGRGVRPALGGGRANSLRRRQTASSEAAGVQAEGDAAGGRRRGQEGAGGADPRAGAAAGAVAAKLNPGETRESWHGPKARSRGPWGTGSRPRETPPATPPSDTLPARVCECRSNRCVSECGARKQKTLFSRAHGTRL